MSTGVFVGDQSRSGVPTGVSVGALDSASFVTGAPVGALAVSSDPLTGELDGRLPEPVTKLPGVLLGLPVPAAGTSVGESVG